MPRAAIIARVARAARRADPRARPGRGLRDRQPHRARAPRAGRRRSRRAAAADPPRRRDLHRPLRVGGAGRLLRRPQPRAADRPHRAVLVAARRLRLPEALERDPASRRPARRRWARSPRRSRAARAWPRMRGRRKREDAVSGAARVAARRRATMSTAPDDDARKAASPRGCTRSCATTCWRCAAITLRAADGMIKLDAMENPYPLPADVRARVAAAVADVAINRYPDGGADALKDALREALGAGRRRRPRARQRLRRADRRC